MKHIPLLLLISCSCVHPLFADTTPNITSNRLPQGGGIIYPAWTGQYWDNPTFSGEPRWEQSEIRVSFDWETDRPIIGSRSEKIYDHASNTYTFPNDNFSARWTGKVIVRFDEPYTFHLTSDERAKLMIRPEGASTWETVIDATAAHQRREDTGTLALKPGQTYEVQLDYADLSGDAVCELRWSSPSTPLEIIDYLGSTSVHHHFRTSLADYYAYGKFNGERYEDGDDYTPKVFDGDIEKWDENGWPLQDFKTVLSGGFAGYGGAHLVHFKGQAEVRHGGTAIVDGQSYERVTPKGVGYDPATNITRFVVNAPEGMREFSMRDTQRTPDSPVGSGVTEIRVMLPRKQGGEAPHAIGEAANGEWIEAMRPYISVRFQAPGLAEVSKWAHRSVPTYSRINELRAKNDFNIETTIQIANETGRDLYYNFGGSWDKDFMHKMALAAKYGTDGKEPYTQDTPNPTFPPLNSNLRLYLEHGNEMGWSAIQPRYWTRYDLPRHKEQNDAVWQALNFNGDGDNSAGFKFHGYRTALMSLAMREVWGPEAMGENIRVLLFGQYQQSHQNTSLQFIDDYFNNGAGQFVKNPLPVHELIWGGGLAVYYGGENYWGESDHVWLQDRSFEAAAVEPGQVSIQPKDSAWTFEGGTGVANFAYDKTPAFQPTDWSQTQKSDGSAVGFQFTTGNMPVYAYATGKQNLSGKGFDTNISLFKADGSKAVQNGRGRIGISLGGRRFKFEQAELQEGAWVFRNLDNTGWPTSDANRPAVYALEPNTSYIILTTERKGSDIPAPVSVQSSPGITIDGAVTANTGNINPGRELNATINKVSGSGTAFPHLNFRFSTGIPLGGGMRIFPPDPRGGPNLWSIDESPKHNTPKPALSGSQTLFIAGQGKVSQDITITEPGEYYLAMTGSSQYNAENPLRISIGEHILWEPKDWSNNGTLGQERKPDNGYYTYGTEYVQLEPGTYTVTIEGLSEQRSDIAYIDAVHIGSMDAYFGGPDASNFMGAGAATGQTDSKFDVSTMHASAMSHNWGIVPTCYEGGNSVGGDWNGGGVLFWEQSKWWHPTTKVADINAANRWYYYGGHQFFHYYPPFKWNDWPNAEKYQQWQAVKERANEWKWEPGFGTPLPATLETSMPHYTGSIGSTWGGYYNPATSDRWKEAPVELTQGHWKSWRVLAPARATHTVTATLGGSAQAELIVNDKVIATGSGTLSATADFTKAIHTVKVRITDGTGTIETITIQ